MKFKWWASGKSNFWRTNINTNQEQVHLFFEFLKFFLEIFNNKSADQFEEEKDELNTTDDREPGEKSHGSPNKTEGGGELDLLVPLDLVEGGRVQVDLDKLQCCGGLLLALRMNMIINEISWINLPNWLDAFVGLNLKFWSLLFL